MAFIVDVLSYFAECGRGGRALPVHGAGVCFDLNPPPPAEDPERRYRFWVSLHPMLGAGQREIQNLNLKNRFQASLKGAA